MQINPLRDKDLDEVMDLFCRCFVEDPYYAHMFPEETTRPDQMREMFHKCIAYCLETGLSLGVTDDGGQLIAFLLSFDYFVVRQEHPQIFQQIFRGDEGEPLPYEDQLHGEIQNLKEGRTLYLLSLTVTPEYRRRGLGSSLIDAMLRNHPQCNLVGDVSNEASLSMYEDRKFHIQRLAPNYFLVLHHQDESGNTFAIGEHVKLLVPNTEVLSGNGISFGVLKENRLLAGYTAQVKFGIWYFEEKADAVASGVVVQLAYDMYLRYQRLINVSQYLEIIAGDCIFYALIQDYTCPPLFNDTLNQMLLKRQTEWSLLPDVYVSIPVQYTDKQLIKGVEENSTAGALIKMLDFRMHCETGIPFQEAQVDDLSNIKNRIKRYYLGKVQVQISGEVTLENYQSDIDSIGPAAFVDLYLAMDEGSNCGVLTWYSLSTPFLISHLLDNIIRNHLMVLESGKISNFFEFVNTHYGLVKKGTPKSFVIIPKGKDYLVPEQIASLLVSETIYPDGESYGRIIDRDIMAIAEDDIGMGQYDRAFVCAYSNVVLQFSAGLMGTIADRISDESITLFYIELILFEEAAIQIADRDIINLATSVTVHTPVKFLTQVNEINDSYSKTIDFWDIKVNYPTSQKSIAMLRTAFGIADRLEELRRNQEHLQTVFDTKCDIIDRNDSKRMDTSLAILSILAVFSAWIDGYDYIATWSDTFPGHIIFLLQRILFVLVLVTAGYAITHLFGNKLALMVQMRRRERSRRKKRRRKR